MRGERQALLRQAGLGTTRAMTSDVLLDGSQYIVVGRGDSLYEFESEQ